MSLILSAQNAKAGILDIALDSLRNLVRKEQKVEVVPVLADDSAVLKITSQTSASSDASVAFERMRRFERCCGPGKTRHRETKSMKMIRFRCMG